MFFGDELPKNNDYAALIVLGGDGTILHRTEYANKAQIPIVGINCGKLGFLSEFETNETENAIKLLKNNDLVIDDRLTLEISFNCKTYYALNDVSVSRAYEDAKRIIVDLCVQIGEEKLPEVLGDGLIIATPTGSTAYSLSAGGAILEPHIDAFCITPIAAHSLISRAVVCSGSNVCTVTNNGGAKAGVFIDGKLVGYLGDGDTISVKKAENKTLFLRKHDFDFFARLNSKMQSR
ncbi:MAG: NAD(+)/NADH kinase [Clostridia bacterium]|nr:NAD(+)/NADH kinase [Clostridia bacterium]